MVELLLATTNPAKIQRYTPLLNEVDGISLLFLSDLAVKEKPEEPYDSVEENAVHKASWYERQTKQHVFAIDDGLYLDFLPQKDQPGARLRRAKDGKTELSDEEFFDYWMEKIRRAPLKATGRFKNAMAICTTEGKVTTKVFQKEVLFTKEPRGSYTPGYPLSGVAIDPYTGKTQSEMTAEEIIACDKRLFQGLEEFVVNSLNGDL